MKFFRLLLTGLLLVSTASAQEYGWVSNYTDSSTNAVLNEIVELPNGEVIVAGSYSKLPFMDSVYVAETTNGFIACYSASGQEKWFSPLIDEDARRIEIIAAHADSQNNIYLLMIGETVTYRGASLMINDSGYLLVKMDNTGVVQWTNSAYTEDDIAATDASAWLFLDDMKVSGAGDIYLTGTFRGTVNLGGGQSLTNQNSLPDVYLAAHQSDGSTKWISHGTGNAGFESLRLDLTDSLLYLGGIYDDTPSSEVATQGVLNFGAYSDALNPNQTGEASFAGQFDLDGNINWLRGFTDDLVDPGTFSGKREQLRGLSAGDQVVHLLVQFSDDLLFGEDTLKAAKDYGSGSNNYALVQLDLFGNLNWYRHIYGKDLGMLIDAREDTGQLLMLSRYEHLQPDTATLISASPGLAQYAFCIYNLGGNLERYSILDDNSFRDVLPSQSEMLLDMDLDFLQNGRFYTAVTYGGSFDVTVGSEFIPEPGIVLIAGNIAVPEAFDLDLGPDIIQCQGSATLDGGEATTWLWSTGDTTRMITVSQSGNYSLTVTDDNGQTATDEVAVTIEQPLVFQFPDTVSGFNTVILRPDVEAFAYSWTTGQETPTVNVDTDGIYGVTLKTEGGCETFAETYVKITLLPIFAGGREGGILNAGLAGADILFSGGVGNGGANNGSSEGEGPLFAGGSGTGFSQGAFEDQLQILYAGGPGTGYGGVDLSATDLLFGGGSGSGYALSSSVPEGILFRGGAGQGYSIGIREAEELITQMRNLLDVEALSLYPNPSDNYFMIRIASDGADTYAMKIYDSSGRFIMEKAQITPGEQVDISTLKQGVYLVSLQALKYDRKPVVKRLKVGQ